MRDWLEDLRVLHSRTPHPWLVNQLAVEGEYYLFIFHHGTGSIVPTTDRIQLSYAQDLIQRVRNDLPKLLDVVDAAQRLVALGPCWRGASQSCYYCGTDYEHVHKKDCVWIHLAEAVK